MDNTISSKINLSISEPVIKSSNEVTNLSQAEMNKEYTIKEVRSSEEDLKNFLFTLGCYAGETVTVVSILSENYIISVKDARYSIDLDLAKTIII